MSARLHGSPGRADEMIAPSVMVNEIKAHTDYQNPSYPEYDSNDWIELVNAGEVTQTLQDWYLSDDPERLTKYSLAGRQIEPGSYLVLDEVHDFHNPITNGFGLNKAGEQVILSYLPGDARDRIVDYVRFEGQENATAEGVAISIGRYPDRAEWWLSMPASAGSANVEPFEDILISEVMYHPDETGEYEYIQLYNPTGREIDFSGEGGAWQLDGDVEFAFPSDFSLAAGKKVIVVGFDPSQSVELAQFIANYQRGF